MKNILKYFILSLFLFAFYSCEDDWLERQPRNIILEEQVWNDPKMIVGLLANYYNRLTMEMSVETNWRNMANYDDAMWSGQSNEDGRNNLTTYGFSSWQYWDYGLIRDINLAIENIDKYSTKLLPADKASYKAELRFIRAFVYFEHVRRMGGVPLITTQLIYDFSGDPTPLQVPRSKEHEVYDFIAVECDAIKDDLLNVGSATRANKYTALALKSRAMLYAGSIAKYNALKTPTIVTAGGEVGIPASMANAYYQKSLDASKEIILSTQYELYKGNPAHKGENFYEVTYKKTPNKEIIFAKDYLTAKDKRHWFAYDNIARNIREDNLGSSSMSPSLNLVESFEYLDGTPGILVNRTSDNTDYIYYDNLSDIFANKDWRCYGTVVYPGTTFKSLPVHIQAGVKVWNTATSTFTTVEGSDIGTIYTADGGVLTGSAGPHRSIQEVSNTGFYFRKFIDAGAMTSSRGVRSDNWWIWFRLGEIYLNAAEAAMELSLPEAVGYVNTVRERAGFPANSLATVDLPRIINERRVELAFEDHRLWDLKRWRVAHEVWDGTSQQARVWALYPYRVYRPGHPTHGKYVFDKMVAPRFGSPRYFRAEGNYYSQIAQSVIDNNPKIVRNPGH
jgi:starch-binding outer membrane protein, SusD/RagB family